ncbi:unnamed protein product [Mycetohabitans rhizoxinica HKI 454]|uniref:Uncharacterized protein n=1 Tax=Mycetohabitans rhizoxinica (strain DSM 19002 / CIP 109453 / HKI 454) TaxID=882378 RepID=E5AS36_MYCRK|nr:unnamed protein product [Mycetohabitans rhizoxinica HKI 454]
MALVLDYHTCELLNWHLSRSVKRQPSLGVVHIAVEAGDPA